MNIPETLFLTFEDGLHVGVFHKPEDAEKLNEMRRKKRNVNPITVRYIRAPTCDPEPVLRIAPEEFLE